MYEVCPHIASDAADTADSAVAYTSAHAGVRVACCIECSRLQFSDPRGYVAPHVALTRLFGGFDLVGALDAIGAPGHQVLMYRPPNRIVAAALRVITPNQWFCADDDLWVCHDGEHLLFAHNSPIATELVGA